MNVVDGTALVGMRADLAVEDVVGDAAAVGGAMKDTPISNTVD